MKIRGLEWEETTPVARVSGISDLKIFHRVPTLSRTVTQDSSVALRPTR